MKRASVPTPRTLPVDPRMFRWDSPRMGGDWRDLVYSFPIHLPVGRPFESRASESHALSITDHAGRGGRGWRLADHLGIDVTAALRQASRA